MGEGLARNETKYTGHFQYIQIRPECKLHCFVYTFIMEGNHKKKIRPHYRNSHNILMQLYGEDFLSFPVERNPVKILCSKKECKEVMHFLVLTYKNLVLLLHRI